MNEAMQRAADNIMEDLDGFTVEEIEKIMEQVTNRMKAKTIFNNTEEGELNGF